MPAIPKPKRFFALLAAAILAVPFFVGPASGAPDVGPQTSGASRAQRVEDRVRSGGGHVVGTSSLLGASVAELTPAEIRTLAADPSVSRIHIDTEVNASAVG